ncbi:hypothetical protein NIES4073_77880 [Kalymmatonema gypsitolerans NIES-4073]|nr:hypothetical protein NIES4073_77880 [Scytonema sp. NIES-4073]
MDTDKFVLYLVAPRIPVLYILSWWGTGSCFMPGNPFASRLLSGKPSFALAHHRTALMNGYDGIGYWESKFRGGLKPAP